MKAFYRIGLAVLALFICSSVRAQGWRESVLPQADTTLFLIDFVDSLHGWVAGSSGRLFHTTDGGSGWQALRVDSPLLLQHMRFFDAEDGFVFGSSNMTSYLSDTLLYFTSDQGITWQRTSLPDSPYVRQVVFVNREDGYILRNEVDPDVSNLWKTVDGSLTWTALKIPFQTQVRSMAFLNSIHGFALDADYNIIWPPPETRIRLTPDGGNSWSLVETIPGTEADRICFQDSTHGFITGYTGYDNPEDPFSPWFIRLSFDAGNSWLTFLSGTLGFVGGIALDSMRAWLVMPFEVLRTSDGGQTWKVYSFNDVVLDFSYIDESHIWLVTSKGRVYRYDITATHVESSSGDLIPQVVQLYQNFPNPFNSTTRMRYELATESSVSLQLFNVLGEAILTIHYGQQAAGKYEVVFQGDNLTSGLYFYRIVAKRKDNKVDSMTRKMLLLK